MSTNCEFCRMKAAYATILLLHTKKKKILLSNIFNESLFKTLRVEIAKVYKGGSVMLIYSVLVLFSYLLAFLCSPLPSELVSS